MSQLDIRKKNSGFDYFLRGIHHATIICRILSFRLDFTLLFPCDCCGQFNECYLDANHAEDYKNKPVGLFTLETQNSPFIGFNQ